jgi:hypothetical protein
MKLMLEEVRRLRERRQKLLIDLLTISKMLSGLGNGP